jgi:hypothetical protein
MLRGSLGRGLDRIMDNGKWIIENGSGFTTLRRDKQ